MSNYEPRLSNQQMILLRVLQTKDERLWSMYYGALKVLNDSNNPERFALAAHSLRELMEKMPLYFDLRMKAMKESLKGKVRELEDIWYDCCEKSTCYKLEWEGNIDGPLRKLLKSLEEFFRWFKGHHPRRKEEIARAIRRLDPMGLPLPEPIEELNPKSGRPLSPVATRTRVLEERYKNPHICRKM